MSLICRSRILIFSATILVLAATLSKIYEPYSQNDTPKPDIDVRRLQLEPEYPFIGEDKVAVAVLVPNTDGDTIDLCLALRSMSIYNVVSEGTDIHVFHEVNFPQERINAIAKCTSNPIFFNEVVIGYDEIRSSVSETLDRLGLLVSRMGEAQGRKRWGYVESIRFWTNLVWKHPAVQEYDVIMRIDSDSCFKGPGTGEMDQYLPGMPDRYVFRSNGPYLGSNVWVRGLYDFAVSYVEKEDIEPANPELWDYVKQAWEQNQTMPVFQKNFAVFRKSFFKRYDVMNWHEAITEGEPFGVLRYRWGEAQTSVLTMALFGTKENLLITRHDGYSHGRGVCAEYVGITSGWQV